MAELLGKVPPLEAALEKKEKDVQAALVEWAKFEHLLRLLMSMDGYLNLNFVKGICERFVRTTHIRTFIYRWMVIVI